MCLALPMKILALHDGWARAEFLGQTIRVNIALTPEVVPGDRVLVHAGAAIKVIDLRTAGHDLDFWREVLHEDLE